MNGKLTPIRGGQSCSFELLVEAIERAGGLVPEHGVALRVLCGGQVPATFSQDVQRLIASGALCRVFVGSEPHLVLRAGESEPSARGVVPRERRGDEDDAREATTRAVPAPPVLCEEQPSVEASIRRPANDRPEVEQAIRSAVDGPGETAAERGELGNEFQLQVRLDVEYERLLLYRVVVAVEIILGLVIARGALLWLLG